MRDTIQVGLDRVGLGWRPELAAGIFTNLDRIDVLEVIADDFFDASRANRRALRTLAAQVPVVLHGVTMGLASTSAVSPARLAKMSALLDDLQPEFWSEHLAFVRGGGVEIGHLAAAPRNPATVEGTAANVAQARAATGAAPLMENVASLINPPGSTMSEAEWIGAVLAAAGAELLLDLHNLYANAINFGFDAAKAVAALPAGCIRAVHLAGGRRVRGGRVLDDHLHDVPADVYALLTEVASRVRQPLTVILERDGAYPAMPVLLAQLQCARDALGAGRQRQSAFGATIEAPA